MYRFDDINEMKLIDGYLPNVTTNAKSRREIGKVDLQENESISRHPLHVTLTYATSLDSCLALGPGLQTKLSGAKSKGMTHYLRSRHDAILVGVGTAIADDPLLNCRLEDCSFDDQPVPIVIDPRAKWRLGPESRLIQAVAARTARAPWIMTSASAEIDAEQETLVVRNGGRYFCISEVDRRGRFHWQTILDMLFAEGMRSVMIEGGGRIINDLLQPGHEHLITSVIITIAPVYLGSDGVSVRPESRRDSSGRRTAVCQFKNVSWIGMDSDMIMCAKIMNDSES